MTIAIAVHLEWLDLFRKSLYRKTAGSLYNLITNKLSVMYNFSNGSTLIRRSDVHLYINLSTYIVLHLGGKGDIFCQFKVKGPFHYKGAILSSHNSYYKDKISRPFFLSFYMKRWFLYYNWTQVYVLPSSLLYETVISDEAKWQLYETSLTQILFWLIHFHIIHKRTNRLISLISNRWAKCYILAANIWHRVIKHFITRIWRCLLFVPEPRRL